MKKILLIHNKYRLTGGEDIAVDKEVKLLKRIYDVEVLYFDNFINNKLFIQFFYFLLNKNYSSIKKIKYKINQFNPDYIYVHNTWFKVSPGIFKELFKLDIPVLLKIHNYRFFCTKHFTTSKHFKGSTFCKGCGLYKSEMGWFNKYFQDSYLRSLFVLIFGSKYYKILKNPKLKILTLTNFQKKFLVNLGIDNKKIFVHRNFINSNLSKKNVIKSEKDYMVYAGRISKEKGVENLIKAFLSSRLSNNFDFKIVGDGPSLSYLKSKYTNSNIQFYGQKDNIESLEIISNSKLVATATNLFEGQPTLLCEASMMGIPSIFPYSESISEFFPKNYELNFESNSIEDIVKVLNKANENKIIKKIGEENKKFIIEMLNLDEYFLSFQRIIEHNI